MDELIDNSKQEEVQEAATMFDESVTISEDGLSSFEAFEGHAETKNEIQSKVLSRIDLGSYAPTSLLLFGDDHSIVSNHIAEGITGELPSPWTTFQLHSTERNVEEETTALEVTLTEARACEPSLVIIDCLDEFDFSDARYEYLEEFVQKIQTTQEQVLIVGKSAEVDTELVDNDSIFEVMVQIPEPDEEFRDCIIEQEIEAAERKGFVTKPTEAWETTSELRKFDIEIDRLKIGVKRTIQRLLEDTTEACPAIHPADIETTLQIIHAEEPDESVNAFGLEVEDHTDEYEPDVPSITFDEIGGLETEKHRLREAVSNPVEYQEVFEAAGYSVGQGILLYGPPGNGKTMLAKAVANELSYRFFAVKGPEMEDPFVGETERKIRELFETARESAPSVIFFDEFDSVAADRNNHARAYKQDHVNALLAELDGMDTLEDVIVMAATNRVDKLDDAVTRSGRFDTFIEISPPNLEEKKEIFSLHIDELSTRDAVTAAWFGSLDISELSGADIAAICRKALELAVTEYDAADSPELAVTRTHIKRALRRVSSNENTDRTSGYH